MQRSTRSAGTRGIQSIQASLRSAACRWLLSFRSRNVAVAVALAVVAGCGSGGASTLDSTPEKLDGTESYEFEQDDLDAAAEASDAIKEYCAGAVSEAQRLGCESHVTDADLP